MDMTDDELERWILELIASDNVHAFYISPQWKRTSKEVLHEQHYECQRCKAKGIYNRATTVHHKKYLRRRPRLALTKNNLESICNDCHYDEHHKKEPKGFTNEERW